MAYTKTNWIARLGTNLNRFAKSEETSDSVILTNTPDSITEPGTLFNVGDMNKIEQGIYDAHESIANMQCGDFIPDELDTWVDTGQTYNGRKIYAHRFKQLYAPVTTSESEFEIATMSGIPDVSDITLYKANIMFYWSDYQGTVPYAGRFGAASDLRVYLIADWESVKCTVFSPNVYTTMNMEFRGVVYVIADDPWDD